MTIDLDKAMVKVQNGIRKHIKYGQLRILIMSKKYMLRMPLPLVRMNLNILKVSMNLEISSYTCAGASMNSFVEL